MFGPRITTVFRSKWRALWFVASVLVGVWYSVPRSGDDDASQQETVQAMAAMLNQPQPAPSEHPANPWAKTSK